MRPTLETYKCPDCATLHARRQETNEINFVAPQSRKQGVTMYYNVIGVDCKYTIRDSGREPDMIE